jgi:D-alanyl-lipoteichoic acid acyltransferase DltB (MBOAT superfamily)
MLFNTTEFGIFFAFVWVIYWILKPWRTAGLGFLLVASLYFYACWDVKYLALLGFVTVFAWGSARLIESERFARWRRPLLIGVVVVNLGVLSFWKYLDFVLNNLHPVFAWLHRTPPKPLELMLPVGISFFTFQGLSYVVDVSQGKTRAEPSLFRFALYKAYFPQLVAGPIVRARDMLPQFEAPARLDAERFGRGLWLVLGGLLKKVVIADFLATHLVDRVFDVPVQYGSLETLAAIYGYALQIYGDFSGYTDIAIGASLMLGYDLLANFDLPYRAVSLQDFWRRWHISLSSWLRDYLYIPLGGSKGGRWQTHRNTMVTMLLGGLWHGASWNFVVWGGLHGVGQVVERLWRDRGRNRWRRWPDWLSGLVTFHFVCLCWVFFRADTFEGARQVLSQVTAAVPGHANLTGPVLGVLALGFGAHFLPRRWSGAAQTRFVQAPPFVQALGVVLALYLLRALSAAGNAPFIYYQF